MFGSCSATLAGVSCPGSCLWHLQLGLTRKPLHLDFSVSNCLVFLSSSLFPLSLSKHLAKAHHCRERRKGLKTQPQWQGLWIHFSFVATDSPLWHCQDLHSRGNKEADPLPSALVPGVDKSHPRPSDLREKGGEEQGSQRDSETPWNVGWAGSSSWVEEAGHFPEIR